MLRANIRSVCRLCRSTNSVERGRCITCDRRAAKLRADGYSDELVDLALSFPGEAIFSLDSARAQLGEYMLLRAVADA